MKRIKFNIHTINIKRIKFNTSNQIKIRNNIILIILIHNIITIALAL